MIREQVINHWTGLKEKINDLKLSEQDKQTVNYLENYPILGLFASNVQDQELADWERKINEVRDQMKLFFPENDVVFNWWYLADWGISIASDWISQRKTISYLRAYIKELEGKDNGSNSGDGPTIEKVD